MAERGSSKFSGMFADRLEPVPTAPPTIPPPAVQEKPVPVEKPRMAAVAQPGRLEPEPARSTRRAGKRSDPDYKQFSVLLRKDTHKQVVRSLDDADTGQDVSELVQQLLAQWVKKQRA